MASFRFQDGSCFHQCGCVGPRTGAAVLQAVAPGLGGRLNSKPLQKLRVRLRHAVGERNHHQRPVPEVFVLVVLYQPVADAVGLADVYAASRRRTPRTSTSRDQGGFSNVSRYSIALFADLK